MKLFENTTTDYISALAKDLYNEEREEHKILNGWLLSRETALDTAETLKDVPAEMRAAEELEKIIETMPLEISRYAVFAGTQRDAFAASYALINPAFQVETFKGYCDPLEVYNFASPDGDVTTERIENMRRRMAETDWVRSLNAVYSENNVYTDEVAFFVEHVTGHVVPDFRQALKHGVLYLIDEIDGRLKDPSIPKKKRINYEAMKTALSCCVTLARRYSDLAGSMALSAAGEARARLEMMRDNLLKVPAYGAGSLMEALQSYLILWQVMCIEQAPNPFAFSVGNADRIFEPYRQMDNASREEAAALFKHFLVFYNVGERSWAISQNVLLGGRDLSGNDLTNPMTYAILDAYYDMILPQPILSVKLHRNTPEEFYASLGRFLFTPGCLTPSFFNDDSLFETLKEHGIAEEDLPDYSVAGCQEPLIMGKDNGNTTNSWLNLGKILELTLNDGASMLTGHQIGVKTGKSTEEILAGLKENFYTNCEFYIDKMCEAANGASRALSLLPVPFLSCFMGGIDTGIDMRDPEEQGTRYNGSGCLIHGLSTAADSLIAVEHLLRERPEDAGRLIDALKADFRGYEDLKEYLSACPKYGNNIPEVDLETAEMAEKISQMVRARKNYLGNPFRPDWSSPSTHLLYGYWVAATPDGRSARDMLNYGVDPLYGTSDSGLGFRVLSMMHLPYREMNGGMACHFGIDPKFFTGSSFEEKGIQFRDRVMKPLFFNPKLDGRAPFYLYVNVTTAETLRKVLAEPKKYAPNGVYIMRIHGTFVNFLDLSPAIQQDIITRLDPMSTAC
ncbi:MAG: hypothetical protein IJJ25_09340 [Lachnospiraceae bacterium]|nr:hypothetical protein [Lachnospiraceae bacterium]